MTSVEVNTQKIELVKQILDEKDETILKKMSNYFKKVKKTSTNSSYQMTIEELKNEVLQAEEEYKKGNCIAHNEFLNKHKEWL